MRICVEIDENCEHCAQGLAYLKELRKRHPECYGSRFDAGGYIPGLLLIPDYSVAGNLLHFHLKREAAKSPEMAAFGE